MFNLFQTYSPAGNAWLRPFYRREITFGQDPRPGHLSIVNRHGVLKLTCNVWALAMKSYLCPALGAVMVASLIGNSVNSADARDRGGIALGVLGGLAAGTIIGSAIAPRAYYPPPNYYEPAPTYYYERTSCYWTQGQPVWDEWRDAWIRPRVRVCD